jgi:hypothetical protein
MSSAQHRPSTTYGASPTRSGSSREWVTYAEVMQGRQRPEIDEELRRRSVAIVMTPSSASPRRPCPSHPRVWRPYSASQGGDGRRKFDRFDRLRRVTTPSTTVPPQIPKMMSVE